MLCNKATHKVPTLCVLEVECGVALMRGVHSLLSSHYWRETPTRGGRGVAGDGEGQGHERRGREGGEAGKGHWEGRHMCRLGEMQ